MLNCIHAAQECDATGDAICYTARLKKNSYKYIVLFIAAAAFTKMERGKMINP